MSEKNKFLGLTYDYDPNTGEIEVLKDWTDSVDEIVEYLEDKQDKKEQQQ